jgi:predicted nucleic acid-binding protein
MFVAIDTNIIVSATLFPESVVAKVFYHILANHELVLSKYVLDEMKSWRQKISCDLFDLSLDNPQKYPYMRDKKDIPVLALAIEANVDILVTGDKDFDDIVIEKPKIMKPREYMDMFMKDAVLS